MSMLAFSLKTCIKKSHVLENILFSGYDINFVY